MKNTVSTGLAARSGRQPQNQDVFNPATGEISRQVSWADPTEVDQAVKVPPQPFQPGGHGRPYPPRPCSPLPRSVESASRRAGAIITSEHGKVLSDAQAKSCRDRRGRVCLRHSGVAEDRLHDQVSTV